MGTHTHTHTHTHITILSNVTRLYEFEYEMKAFLLFYLYVRILNIQSALFNSLGYCRTKEIMVYCNPTVVSKLIMRGLSLSRHTHTQTHTHKTVFCDYYCKT